MKQESYEEFISKFNKQPPKTTDDCYTPQDVYDKAVEIAKKLSPEIEGVPICRPFYPGGDYQKFIRDYDGNGVVIDNPPFSKYSKICHDFEEACVPYFLFGPGLTLFNRYSKGYVLVDSSAVTFTNGAQVRIGFATNLLKGVHLVGIDLQVKDLKRSKKTQMPPGFHTSAQLLSKVKSGEHIVLDILPAPMYTKAYGKAFKLKERSRNELQF